MERQAGDVRHHSAAAFKLDQRVGPVQANGAAANGNVDETANWRAHAAGFPLVTSTPHRQDSARRKPFLYEEDTCCALISAEVIQNTGMRVDL